MAQEERIHLQFRRPRDAGSIPGSGRCPEGENGNPLQYSCLGNPMDRGPHPWGRKRIRHDLAIKQQQTKGNLMRKIKLSGIRKAVWGVLTVTHMRSGKAIWYSQFEKVVCRKTPSSPCWLVCWEEVWASAAGMPFLKLFALSLLQLLQYFERTDYPRQQTIRELPIDFSRRKSV